MTVVLSDLDTGNLVDSAATVAGSDVSRKTPRGVTYRSAVQKVKQPKSVCRESSLLHRPALLIAERDDCTRLLEDALTASRSCFNYPGQT